MSKTLVKNIAEVKAVLAISSLDDQSSLPDILSAEISYIIPEIGKPLYDALISKYHAEPSALNDDEKALLSMIQKPLVAFAYLDEIGLRHAMITDAGIRTNSSESMAPARRWELEKLEQSLANRAYQSLEALLQFLETKQATFPLWGSEQQTRRQQCLIKSGSEFTEIFSLSQPMRTYSVLRPIMLDVQNLYIIPAIGKEFFDELKGLTAPTNHEKQVIDDLKRAIVNYTISHAGEKLSVRFDSTGFTVNGSMGAMETVSAGRENAPGTHLSLLISSTKRDGDSYMLKAKQYLNQYAAAGVFANYFSSPFYQSPVAAVTTDRNANRRNFSL
jgi:hypothetical protein